MKMDVATNSADWNGDMLFHGDSREMIVVDHDKKSYYVIDEEQLEKLASSINQAMSSMEQALAALPEGQRAKMEQMMKSRMPAMAEPREPSELKKTGASDTVNGFDCEIYEVWRSGVRERELCVTGLAECRRRRGGRRDLLRDGRVHDRDARQTCRRWATDGRSVTRLTSISRRRTGSRCAHPRVRR